MNRLSKRMITLLAVLAIGAAAAGCSSPKAEDSKDNGNTAQNDTTQDSGKENEADTEKDGDTDSADAGSSGEEITLRYAWWGGDARHEAVLEAIALYEERNPNIKVEGEYQGYDGYYEKMMTTLSSGTAPDLFHFTRDWLADVQSASHYLADLSELLVDTSTLKEGLKENSGSYNGEFLMLPAVVGGQVVYVNTEFAEEYGIDIDRQYTWEEIIELGREIHEQDPEAYLMTADIDVLNRLILLSHLVQQTGESLIDGENYELTFTQEQMEASLQLILDLYESNTLEPFGESAVFVGQIDQNNKWLNGKIGLVLDNTGSATKYLEAMRGKIDVMANPILPDAVCSGVDFGGNRGTCINDNSPYKEEAAKFLDFLTNDPDAIEILGVNMGYPPTTFAEEVLEEAGIIDPIQRKGVEMAEIDAYSSNDVSGNTELETIRKDIIQEIVYGDITPAEGAAEIAEEYEKILEALKN